MTREEKSQVIQDLTAVLAGTNTLYLADISGLNAQTTSNLRRACFKAGVQLSVVKNTLLAKAMEASDKEFGDLPTVLKGNTSMMISEAANAPVDTGVHTRRLRLPFHRHPETLPSSRHPYAASSPTVVDPGSILSIFEYSHSLLHSGQAERVFSQRWMQSR